MRTRLHDVQELGRPPRKSRLCTPGRGVRLDIQDGDLEVPGFVHPVEVLVLDVRREFDLPLAPQGYLHHRDAPIRLLLELEEGGEALRIEGRLLPLLRVLFLLVLLVWSAAVLLAMKLESLTEQAD